MNAVEAYALAILQGVSELFPVSSLGHAVILPPILGWAFDRKGPDFLPFLVALHAGTAAALLLYFRRDWWGFARAILSLERTAHRAGTRRLFRNICIATLPAVVIGGAFEKMLRGLFGSTEIAAAFLIVNGWVLFAGERLRRRGGSRALDHFTWRDALYIGFAQCGALIPGISRSGITMVAGLRRGLTHEAAARFSFLIALPIILGAAVLEMPHLFSDSADPAIAQLATGAGIVAGVAAYASLAFLMRYFGTHDFESLDPFAYYCWALGGGTLIYFLAAN